MTRSWPLFALLLLASTGCDTTHHARVRDGHGLSQGAPVLVSGVPIGQVSALHVIEGEVDIEFSVDSDHEITLRDDSCVRVTAGDGAPALVLLPGVGQPLETEQLVPECEPELPAVGEFLEQLGEGMGQLMQQLGQGFFRGSGGGGGANPSSPPSGGFPIPILPPSPPPPQSPPPTSPAPAAPPPALPAPPPSPSGSTSPSVCDDLSVRLDGTSPVRPVPAILPPGGHRVALVFDNRGPETVTIGSVGEATFVSADRHTLRVTPMPGAESDWFMPFEVAARSTARVSVVFAGEDAPQVDELEVRGVAPIHSFDRCTLRAENLSR